MLNRFKKILCVFAALSCCWDVLGAELETSATIELFEETGMTGIKIGVRKAGEKGELPQKIVSCMLALDKTELSAFVQYQLKKNLSARELLEADAYYSSSTGVKTRKIAVLSVYRAAGLQAPSEAPRFTLADIEAAAAFKKTSAHKKLNVQRVMDQPEVAQMFQKRIGELIQRCKDN